MCERNDDEYSFLPSQRRPIPSNNPICLRAQKYGLKSDKAIQLGSRKKAGQQTALASTLDSLCIHVCCLSETRSQNVSTVTELIGPSLSFLASHLW
ncbi:hypothetical protein T265_00441 [Opisthorchis viverrini]|uniref:Uncharacterized protein n=1 Tax=Opisthorchis viverrini TaxID=6198 RepID=A0A075A231_OPIVI|nr:hypothetical protein T265_00441 [Opisthorchis viverrini]KER33763.1 hypothetical protein T265_00441 [Opisthorchis viverrini]